MSDDPELFSDAELQAAVLLLPAWFVPRMMSDQWHFVFLMVNGDFLHFSTINDVTLGSDGIWIDVELADVVPPHGDFPRGARHIGAPTSRLSASVNSRHIMAAFETADT